MREQKLPGGCPHPTIKRLILSWKLEIQQGRRFLWAERIN
jgi:hypothetical protein